MENEKTLPLKLFHNTIHKISKQEISTLSFKNIAFLFIKEVSNISPDNLDFVDLFNQCKSDSCLSSIMKDMGDEPISPDIFYKNFCKKIWFVEEPMNVYFQLLKEKKKTITEIKNRLEDLYTLRSKVKSKKQIPNIRTLENAQENYTLITFFIENNKKELKKNEKFLLNNLEEFAISKCIKNEMIPFFTGSFLHNFIINIPFFKNRLIDLNENFILMERFQLLPYDENLLLDIKNSYGNYLLNGDDTYLKYLKSYCNENSILDSLQKKCNKHHILFYQKAIVEQCIKLYGDKQYLAVAILVPTVVECLINNICLMYTTDKHYIYSLGLSAKISLIQNKNALESHYFDYFRYFFPAVRNHLAHGWINNFEELDIETLATHLILDLYSICGILVNAKSPMNCYLKLLGEIKNIENINSFEKILKFFEFINITLDGIEVDSFYKIEEKQTTLKEYFLSKEFQTLLLLHISSDDNKFKDICQKVTQIKRNSTNDIQVYCEELLKKMREEFRIKKIASENNLKAFKQLLEGK